MSSSVDPSAPGRRHVLAVFVGSVVGLIGASLGSVLGAFALGSTRASAKERWVRAAAVGDLTADTPVPCVVSVPEVDGWYRARARHTVFLVWDGDQQIHALSATCTHLGCQVAWNAEAKQFKCPCHGGKYDVQGRVVGGPPPRPLATLPARITGGTDVLVQL